jgi:hypothetical protein
MKTLNQVIPNAQKRLRRYEVADSQKKDDEELQVILEGIEERRRLIKTEKFTSMPKVP